MDAVFKTIAPRPAETPAVAGDVYSASAERYANRAEFHRRCGRSGLTLPAISLGCWYNFGEPAGDEATHHENCRRMIFTAFDAGIFHIDLANNYGPPAGGAEERVGTILKSDLARYRSELVIATKAGCPFGPGPFGSGASRKNLLGSIDESLRRLKLDYVDIFYSHKPDPTVLLEETLFALDTIVRQGKAVYTGISSYSGQRTQRCLDLCKQHGWVAPLVHQSNYSLVKRDLETDLMPVTSAGGMGIVAYSTLAQGILSGRYNDSIPTDSRGGKAGNWDSNGKLTPALLAKVRKLADIAIERGQTLSQLALQWVLRPMGDRTIASALVGASRPEQISENVRALSFPPLTEEELVAIDAAL